MSAQTAPSFSRRPLKKTLLAAALASLFALPVAAQEPPPKWGPHIDFEAKPGSKRTLGEADLFFPVRQTTDSLLFANIRVRMDDGDSHEGNIGMGYRQMYESGWNLGVYGYLDRRKSAYDNYFTQSTFGVEALGRDLDFRLNTYLPVGTKSRTFNIAGSSSSPYAQIVGSQVQVITPGSDIWKERAMKGVDAEAGWRLPLFDADDFRQVRVYLGGYRFSGDGMTVEGPRARLEMALEDLPSLGRGAALYLGGEIQHDNTRGTQQFVSLRLRIPLGGTHQARNPLSLQERRMTAPVMRDVDIVTKRRHVSSVAGKTEISSALEDGTLFTLIESGTTSGAGLPAAVAVARPTVLLSGDFTTTATIDILPGQTVIGGGTVNVRSLTGVVAPLTLSQASITGNFGAGTGPTVQMADNSTLKNLSVNNTYNAGGDNEAIGLANRSNVTLSGNTITVNNTAGAAYGIVGMSGAASGLTVSHNTIRTTGNTGGYGVAVLTTGSVNISNNTLQAAASAGALNRAHALEIMDTGSGTQLTAAGNQLSASGTSLDNAVWISGGTGSIAIQAASTGNTKTSGGCSTAGTITGNIRFTDSTTCP